MIFRQLFDRESSTYTYLIADPKTNEALFIDPVIEQLDRDVTLLQELSLKLSFAVDTHVHADHISSLGKLRALTRCQTGMSHQSGASGIVRLLKDDDVLNIGALSVTVIETPGHTNGCLSYFAGDRVFTGDALLIRGCGRTDFQEGNAERLYDSITQKLFTLSNDTLVFPAHDYKGFTVSTVFEEKKLNPRLNKSKKDFVDFMRNLKLTEPKMIHTAVPINLGGNESP